MLNYLAHGGTEASYLSSGEISVNWVAILLATIAAMVIGSLWYGPLFGKRWMNAAGLKKKDMQGGSWWPMIAMFGLALAQAIILAHFIAYAANFYIDYDGWTVGLLTGTWAFAGFVAPVLISNTMFAKGSTEFLKINLGNQLITLLVMGAIIGSMS